MTKNRHQGKFHLLVVFAIPVLFLLVFLVRNWYFVAAFLALLAIVLYLLFRKKK